MKTIKDWKGEDEVCYQDKDMQSGDFQVAVAFAQALWSGRCAEYMEAHGDEGSCVLGAGIKVSYLAPRARNASDKLVIRVHGGVTHAQGANVWEASVKEVLAYLKTQGIEAWYCPGKMD